MKRESVKVPGYKDCFVTGLKLSSRLKWESICQDDKTLMVPALLSLCVVSDDKPIMTQDEWDEFGADNYDVCVALFNQCLNLVSSVEKAKKK